MDAVALITAAVTAGVMAGAKGVAAQAVKDAYAGLKKLLLERFGDQGDLSQALEMVEKKPEGQARQAVLAEALKDAGAGADAALLQAAQALLDLDKAGGPPASPTFDAQVTGSGAIAQGTGAQAAGEGAIIAGGDVKISGK